MCWIILTQSKSTIQRQCSIHLYKKRESSEKKEKNPGSQRLGMVQGVDYKGTEWGNIWGDGAVLYYDCGGGYTTIHICQNLYNCIPQGVNFTICFKNMNKIKQNLKFIKMIDKSQNQRATVKLKI